MSKAIRICDECGNQVAENKNGKLHKHYRKAVYGNIVYSRPKCSGV